MASRRNGTLYTGVTSDLKRRAWEHRTGALPGSFTARYGCKTLVWYCAFDSIVEAIAEEKRIKAGNRLAKLRLIEELNPNWNDLWEEVQEW